MKKPVKKIITALLDGVEWIYKNKPEGEKYTAEDRKNMRKIREMRKKLK